MMVPDDKVCFEESCASSWRFQWQQTSRNGIGKDYHGWGVECPAVATTKNDFWLNIMLDMLALYQRWCMLARTNMYVYIYTYHINTSCLCFDMCTFFHMHMLSARVLAVRWQRIVPKRAPVRSQPRWISGFAAAGHVPWGPWVVCRSSGVEYITQFSGWE